MEDGLDVGLYIHIPFCRAKCAYCDFTSYAHLDDLHDEYTDALVQEIEQAPPLSVHTVYIGGGTPTVLPLSHFARIFEAVHRTFATGAMTEITIEANPGTISLEQLAGLRSLGATRLSLGVQSLVDSELRLLGRIHSASEAIDAFHAARQAGFDSLSLDLLYGLPGQQLASWRTSLEQALTLDPDHLSLYALTLEEGTPLAAAISRGHLPTPDPDLAADMYEHAQDMLADAGFLHYEISNWARSSEWICQHNLTYWRNEPYLGIGAGAHSWMGRRRWANVPRPEEYSERVSIGQQPIATIETIGIEMEMGETMILGLRLLDEGVSLMRFQARFGMDLCLRFADELRDLAQLGLVDTSNQRVILSERGRLLGNQVFLRFLAD